MPEKTVLANYIVRIYRYEKNRPVNLVGIVEEVGTKGKKAFTNLNELWDILSSSKEVRNKVERISFVSKNILRKRKN